MGERVLLEKVRPREPTGLFRPRLVDRLVGQASPGLALVIAAPGSGKTTLLAQAAHHGSEPTAWFCAGPEDGPEKALVRHLAQAMVTAGERLERPMDSVDALLEATEAIHHPALLVVDDLHALAGTPAEAGLERFLWLRPRHLRVLLGSRRPPSMNTPRLQASASSCSWTARTCASGPGRSRSCSAGSTAAPVAGGRRRPDPAHRGLGGRRSSCSTSPRPT